MQQEKSYSPRKMEISYNLAMETQDDVRQFILAQSNAAGRGKGALAEWSRALGRNDAYLHQFIHRKTPRKLDEDDRKKLAELIGVPEADLLVDGSPAPAIPVIRPGGPESSEVEPATAAPKLSQFGDFDVEVRGITVGGSDDEFYFNGEVNDHIRRPPGIRRANNVFALNVSGESMMPRYEPGEPIYVQRTNPAVGDYVVVELYPEDDNQAGKSFLKQLVRRTGLRVTCRQFNPPKEVEFDAGEIKEIYRVLKPRELLG